MVLLVQRWQDNDKAVYRGHKMAEWRFGNILADGFKNETQKGFSEVNPDAGSIYRRQEFTDVKDIIQGRFILTQTQYIDFMDWYRNEVRQGSLSFDYYDCRVDLTRTATILGKPTWQAVSNQYYVSITLALDEVEQIIDVDLVSEAGEPIVSEAGEQIVTTVKVRV